MPLTHFLTPLLGGIGAVALILFPLFLLGFILHKRRKKFRAFAEDPFTEMPLRPPGESLRLKIEDLNAEFDSALALTGFICAGFLGMVLALPVQNRELAWCIVGVFLTAFYVGLGRHLWTLQRKLWDHRLGFTGERAVGEELNQLLAQGFKVFHDVPFDDYNIDHVLVGAAGVFAIETKTRRKPADIKGLSKATVTVNGDILEYPWGRERKAIDQIRLNVRSLSQWLTKATGEPTPVSGILALPCWNVVGCPPSDLKVLNPKLIKYAFKEQPTNQLTPDRIQRIAYQLSEKCRIPKPDSK